MKTIIFEKKYGVNIEDFSTTTEVDEFMEEKLGKKLKVKRVRSIDETVRKILKI